MAEPKIPSAWRDLDLSGHPILVVGWRPGPQKLEAAVVDLHEETFDTMREIARSTTNALSERTSEPWHPNAPQEAREQYLTVAVEELPSPPKRRARRQKADSLDVSKSLPVDHQLVEAAAMLLLVLKPGNLDNINPAGLQDRDPLFYAIVWEQADGDQPAAFVSQYDPTTVLKKAHRFFRYEGTLRSAPAPALTLNDRADMVITPLEIAVIRASAFDHLFSDIRALLNDVPKNVKNLDKALTMLPFGSGTLEALEKACLSRPSLARRLQNLGARGDMKQLTPVAFGEALKNHGGRPDEFLIDGKLLVNESQVRTFLDIAEGRWYEADFTGERRRAGSWSRR